MKTVFVNEKSNLELCSISAERIGFVPMEVGNQFVDELGRVWIINSKRLVMAEARNGMQVYHTPVLTYFLVKP